MDPLTIIGAVGGVLKTVASPFIDHFKKKQEMKEEKQRTKLEIERAKQRHIQNMASTSQSARNLWELKQIDNSGWKDEYWTVILSIPTIFCFIPGLAPYVVQGFEALAQTPEWYRGLLGIAILAAFGYKKHKENKLLK
jgi:hypothetical protein